MSKKTTPRWWPFIAIWALAIASFFLLQLGETNNQQQTNGMAAGIIVFAILLSFIWAMFFSRFRLANKLKILGTTALIVLLAIGLLRIRGVDGNGVPIVELRWSGAGETAGLTTEADSTGWYSENDYPRFLGVKGDAKIRRVALKSDWQNNPPQVQWKQAIGEGWSGFALTGKYAITQEQRDSSELVVCYEIKSGKKVWEHADQARYATTVAGIGPRSTPAVINDRVYTTGSTGLLNCLDLKTGQEIWSRNVITETSAKAPMWGFSRSPVPMDSLVLISAGGSDNNSLIAFHQETGEIIWSGGSDPASYSTPVVGMIGGQRQVLVLNLGILTAHSAEDGQVLWHQKWTERTSPCIAQPLILENDRVFISTGYGEGCGLYQIRQQNGLWSSEEIWRTPRMKAKFAHVIRKGDYIYGLDDGVLACIGLDDGQRRWKKGRYGHGQLLLFKDVLLLLSEKGEMILVEATAEEHKEIARFQALDGKTWNTPAFSFPFILMRNDRQAACYRLPAEKQQNELFSQLQMIGTAQ